METTINDSEILKTLYRRASELKDKISRHKEGLTSCEEQLRKTKIAIDAFDGDANILDEFPIELADSPSKFLPNGKGKNNAPEITWKDRIHKAIIELKSATPNEISDYLKKLEPQRPLDQIRKGVIKNLPELIQENKIKYVVLSGTKRQRKKYSLK